MKKNMIISLAFSCLLACTTDVNGPGSIVEKNEAQKVEFSVKINASTFSKNAEVKVLLYDPVAIKAADDSADCSVAFDPTTGGTLNNNCPNAKEAKPEEFIFKSAEIGETLTINSQKVNIGEKYRLMISGKASDDCNTASAQQDGIAESGKLSLENLNFAQTEMACVK